MTTPGEHRIECGLAAILAAKFIALLGGDVARWRRWRKDPRIGFLYAGVSEVLPTQMSGRFSH